MCAEHGAPVILEAPATTTLRQFFEYVFGPEHPRSIWPHYKIGLRCHVTRLGKFLGREPLLTDLTVETLTAFAQASLVKYSRHKTALDAVSFIRRLWGMAFEKGAVNKRPPQSSRRIGIRAELGGLDDPARLHPISRTSTSRCDWRAGHPWAGNSTRS